MAEPCQELIAVLPDEVELRRTFWLAAPADRRELARVRALWDYLRELVECNQSFLLGDSPAWRRLA